MAIQDASQPCNTRADDETRKFYGDVMAICLPSVELLKMEDRDNKALSHRASSEMFVI